MLNKYLVEFLGSLFFIYIILATGNAIAIGAALAIAIMVGGPISGGMFNPAVSIAMVAAGKLSSSHDYPLRGRGGQGVSAMDRAMRGGPLVACFPVERSDQIMMATSTGQSIRCPVEGISFRSRSAGGVRVFNTGGDEVVVSVARIADQGEDDTAE